MIHARITAGYRGRPPAIEGVEFDMAPGEILGLVGQSGSGKSTLALALLRLLEWRGGSASGEIEFEGADLMRLPERQMRALRGRRIALVFQSPLTALNPALRIGTQFHQAWRAHAAGDSKPHALAALDCVSLPAEESFLERYPSQLSVGQAQRVLIALAILHSPSLMVADEPTSALDAITQSEILDLFRRLNRERGMAILYISHDLASVASFCHRVAILEQGRIVEINRTETIFNRPSHPYTARLLAALPAHPVAGSRV